MRPPRPAPVALHCLDGLTREVPGRAHRGLALTAPHNLTPEGIEPLPQDRERPAWGVHHVASGLRVGQVYGRMTDAWAELVRLAEAADWERPAEAVREDPVCQGIYADLHLAFLAEVDRYLDPEDHA